MCAANISYLKAQILRMSRIEKKNRGTLWKLFKEELDENQLRQKLINLINKHF